MSTAAPSVIHILIIEDSKGDAMLLTRALQEPSEQRYDVHHAKTLEEASKALAQNNFDVALLDRTLPDASEFTGLWAIQNRAPKLPVIYLTGHQDERTAFDAIRQGAQDYIFKDNYTGAQLRRAIQYACARKEFEEELIQRANYDMLTGLANRALFESRLALALSRSKRHGGGIAVLFLDLDGFKLVNDTYGHMVGDRLLIEVGTRLRQSVRAHDVAARFGGDEFALLIENIDESGSSKIVAEKILQSLVAPIDIHGREVKVGVSIGVVETAPGETENIKDILRQADAAMYTAKAIPGSCYRYAERGEAKRDAG